ncbi:hypothetical protein D3C86_2102070 [compost metagenome]
MVAVDQSPAGLAASISSRSTLAMKEVVKVTPWNSSTPALAVLPIPKQAATAAGPTMRFRNDDMVYSFSKGKKTSGTAS